MFSDKLFQKIQRAERERRLAPRRKHALLINGSSDDWHRENLTLAHRTLTGKGFAPEQIFTLDCKNRKHSDYTVDDQATHETLRMVTEHLARVVKPKDVLFVYATGHGGRIGRYLNKSPGGVYHDSTLFLPSGQMEARTFSSLFGRINPESGICVADQCYGEAFAQAMGYSQYTGVSACEAADPSVRSVFPRAFFTSWDQSSKVNLEELFEAAKGRMPTELARLPLDAPKEMHLSSPKLYGGKSPTEIFL